MEYLWMENPQINYILLKMVDSPLEATKLVLMLGV